MKHGIPVAYITRYNKGKKGVQAISAYPFYPPIHTMCPIEWAVLAWLCVFIQSVVFNNRMPFFGNLHNTSNMINSSILIWDHFDLIELIGLAQSFIKWILVQWYGQRKIFRISFHRASNFLAAYFTNYIRPPGIGWFQQSPNCILAS